MFSWPNKWEHASFGRNKTSIELARKNLADVHCKWEHASFGRNKTPVELAQKNLADLHCTFFMQHQNTKTNFHCRNKNIICQRGFF